MHSILYLLAVPFVWTLSILLWIPMVQPTESPSGTSLALLRALGLDRAALGKVLVMKNIKFRGKDCKANTSESICWLIYQHTEQWDHTSIFVFHYCHFLPLKYSCFWNTQKFLANPMINSQQKSLYFLSFPEDFIYFFLTAKHNKINPSCFTVLGIQFWPGMSRAICSILSRMVFFKNLTLTWEAVTGTASWL